MFDQILSRQFHILRHRSGPYSEERQRYLSSLIQEGRSRKTLQDICGLLYSISQLLPLDRRVTIPQIEAAADEYGKSRHCSRRSLHAGDAVVRVSRHKVLSFSRAPPQACCQTSLWIGAGSISHIRDSRTRSRSSNDIESTAFVVRVPHLASNQGRESGGGHSRSYCSLLCDCRSAAPMETDIDFFFW